MPNQNNIERYLDGKMNPAEQASFRQEMAADPSLSEEFTLEKTARSAIVEAGREEMRHRLADFEEEWEAQNKPRLKALRPAWRGWAVAAAILVMAGMGLWFFGKNAPRPEQLFAENFEPYRPPSNVRDIVSPEPEIWQKASLDYATGDYAAAAEGFRRALEDSTVIPYLAHFYLGASLLAQPKPDAEAAIQSFDFVLENDTDYRQQAMWFRGLALLEMGRLPEAKTVFREIAGKGFFHKKEAEGILEVLEKGK